MNSTTNSTSSLVECRHVDESLSIVALVALLTALSAIIPYRNSSHHNKFYIQFYVTGVLIINHFYASDLAQSLEWAESNEFKKFLVYMIPFFGGSVFLCFLFAEAIAMAVAPFVVLLFLFMGTGIISSLTIAGVVTAVVFLIMRSQLFMKSTQCLVLIAGNVAMVCVMYLGLRHRSKIDPSCNAPRSILVLCSTNCPAITEDILHFYPLTSFVEAGVICLCVLLLPLCIKCCKRKSGTQDANAQPQQQQQQQQQQKKPKRSDFTRLKNESKLPSSHIEMNRNRYDIADEDVAAVGQYTIDIHSDDESDSSI